jgi:hypothetical protein
LKDAEQKSIRLNKENWENELVHLVQQIDGCNCPLERSCSLKNKDKVCLGKSPKVIHSILDFNDHDSLIGSSLLPTTPEGEVCQVHLLLFDMVRRISQKYSKNFVSKGFPVPIDKIEGLIDDLPIEIRHVPLKRTHGAVWRLQDSWIIYLNEKDSDNRKRFTLYHELFHVLTHNSLKFRYKGAGYRAQDEFIEVLADYFSGTIVMPGEVIKEKWPEINSIKKMADYFGIPESLMYCGLKSTKLM